MKYILKKLMFLTITLLVVSALAFLAFQIVPGDPTSKLLGTEATPERTEQLRAQLGLNRPVTERYLSWLAGIFNGDLGISYSYRMPVSSLIGGMIPITLTLSAMAFVMVAAISLPVGFLLARFEGGVADKIMKTVNQIIMAIPPFFIGIIFTYIFGLIFKLFSPGTFVSYKDSIAGFFGYLFFPALAIALPKSAMTVKLLRASILAEMSKEYIRTAYSRGNSRASALRRHALPNAIVPVMSFLAMTLADIVAGSVIIERVFVIPGLGKLLLLSISNRDYPVVQAIVVILAFVIVISNYFADIICMRIDPRLELG